MKITVGGPPGSGKTTIAEKISHRFGYEHISAGKIFRKMAEERCMNLDEFSAYCQRDESIDREVDRLQMELARENTVTEGRMAAFVVETPDLKIWLDAPLQTRVARIAAREGKPEDEIRELTLRREESENWRYREYYGVNIYDTKAYDLSINTQKWSAEEVFVIIEHAILMLLK